MKSILPEIRFFIAILKNVNKPKNKCEPCIWIAKRAVEYTWQEFIPLKREISSIWDIIKNIAKHIKIKIQFKFKLSINKIEINVDRIKIDEFNKIIPFDNIESSKDISRINKILLNLTYYGTKLNKNKIKNKFKK